MTLNRYTITKIYIINENPMILIWCLFLKAKTVGEIPTHTYLVS